MTQCAYSSFTDMTSKWQSSFLDITKRSSTFAKGRVHSFTFFCYCRFPKFYEKHYHKRCSHREYISSVTLTHLLLLMLFLCYFWASYEKVSKRPGWDSNPQCREEQDTQALWPTHYGTQSQIIDFKKWYTKILSQIQSWQR